MVRIQNLSRPFVFLELFVKIVFVMIKKILGGIESVPVRGIESHSSSKKKE